ncbi:MAG: hypothetical protein WEA56_03570 [Balneolaceae bacterium]
MQDGARFFAYSTWLVMISLAIILFTNRFLSLVYDPGWIGLAVLLAFGLLYLNLTYAAVKRYIRKVPAPTNLHYALAFLIYLPPAVWIIAASQEAEGSEFILLAVLALACILGAIYGNRSGIKARFEYIQKLKKHQEEMESRNT